MSERSQIVLTRVLAVAAASLMIMALFPGAADMAGRALLSPRATFDPDATSSGNYLHNGSFQGHYTDGLADDWSDGSTAGVRYAEDQVGQHSGATCLRVEMQDSGQGVGWQMGQYRMLPWGWYRASIWMRSDGKLPVTVTVRGQNGDVYLVDKFLVQQPWQRYALKGYVSRWSPCSITLTAARPGTLWIEDADLRMTGGGFAGVIALACAAALLAVAVFALVRLAVRQFRLGPEGSRTTRERARGTR